MWEFNNTDLGFYWKQKMSSYKGRKSHSLQWRHNSPHKGPVTRKMTSSWGSIDLCWCKCRVETPYDTVYYITVSSNDRHGVANHRSIECLFNSLFRLTTKKHQSSHYCPFVRGIHRWPVDSPHKGPVTPKMFPFGDIIICIKILREAWHWQVQDID